MINFLDANAIITTLGLIGIFIVVFTESGLFFGFFLPGDSLLFTAGLLASQGYLPFPLLVIGCTVAAILGDSVGYYFGKKIGPRIFKKENSIFFNKRNVDKAREFYKKHGKKTIIIARFIPIVRTFAPILAGVGQMKYGTFLSYNIIGGILWCVSLPTLGYVLGNTIPNIDVYLLPIILFIVIVSTAPVIAKIMKVFRKEKSN